MNFGRLLRAIPAIFPLVLAAQSEAPPAGAPRPETLRDFTAYVRLTDTRVDGILQDRNGFLWANTPERRARLRAAGVICQPRGTRGDVKVSQGLIHDWVGAAFIPGATLEQVLAPLQDYDNHKNHFRPEVVDSKTLERKGNDFKVRLRLVKRKIVRVVLEIDSDVQYRPLAEGDWSSRSRGTRIVEIANAGSPRERVRTAAEDHGYLWRLESYWLFRERDGGVYVECEAVSLSRGIPASLAWLIEPIVRSLPKEELLHTLTATRTLVMNGLHPR